MLNVSVVHLTVQLLSCYAVHSVLMTPIASVHPGGGGGGDPPLLQRLVGALSPFLYFAEAV